jgi:hypothetical protein
VEKSPCKKMKRNPIIKHRWRQRSEEAVVVALAI